MEKYEYKLLTISVAHLNKNEFQAELEQKFEEWGNDGWELIKMEPVNDGGFFSIVASTTKFFVVFKRVKGN